MNVAVIGCGGTGGWVANLLAKMLGEEDILVLVDKDKFEKKNMDRQLNCKVGMSKATALAQSIKARCAVETILEWFSPDMKLGGASAIFCCADNHRARVACLAYADSNTATAYIGGNEYSSFDACAYRRFMKGHELMDPRVRFPEIMTDKTGDPLSPSCTGEVLEGSPQLALANMQTATALCRLWYTWEFVVPNLGLGFNLEAGEHENMDEMFKLTQTIEQRISGTENRLSVERVS